MSKKTYKGYLLRYRERNANGKFLIFHYYTSGLDFYDASIKAITAVALELISVDSPNPGYIYSSINSIEIKDNGHWRRVGLKNILDRLAQ